MKFQAVTVALLAVSAFAAPLAQEPSQDVAIAPQSLQPAVQTDSFTKPSFKTPGFTQPKEDTKNNDKESSDPLDKNDNEDLDASKDEEKHSLEWSGLNNDVVWWKPNTWFSKDADEKLEKGVVFLGEGVAGGVVGAIGFKIGEELFKDAKDLYKSN